ncbi:secreted/surface protein with fasciclin-like repeat domain [Nitzschia inconspicua]|uniref:Secreted/surface protein with fasciclin-like repeat domain n=1 Tax=Nitzschia inconspicua TaxID=303405 RepID=A0A9K3PS27_9STRA|nr:secreted/surface protein with fasciclin-like repeat domain [Nitzschia inconspicua]
MIRHTFLSLLPLFHFLFGNGVSAQDDNCSTITQIACETPGFEILCDAIRTTNLNDDLDSELWTVFAPTNEAFLALPEPVIDFFLDDINMLTDLLLLHVTGTPVNSTTLECNQDLLMANGDFTTTFCEDRASINGTNSSTLTLFQVGPGNVNEPLPRIIVADIQACNGIVHVIDQVILLDNVTVVDVDDNVTVIEDDDNVTVIEDDDNVTIIEDDDNVTMIEDDDNVTIIEDDDNVTIIEDELESDMPSDMPSSMPSTLPSDSPSEFPTLVDNLNVTEDCSGNLTDVLCDDDDFSTLCTALEALGMDVGMTVGTFTLFAPNNEAFAKLGDAAVSYLLQPEQIELLANVLLFHVVPDTILMSNDLNCAAGPDSLVTMANGEDSRTVCNLPLIYQKGAGNEPESRRPQIIQADIMDACNGVIHVVDEVMLYELAQDLGLPAPDEDIIVPPVDSPVSIGELSGMPSDMPSQAPSITELVSNMPSDVPSDMPSDGSSETPSDLPSEAPSEQDIITELPTVDVGVDGSSSPPSFAPPQPTGNTRPPEASCETIDKVLCADPQYKALCERLEKTGLIGALQTGNWTLFAPDNQAFVSLPRGYLDFLDDNIADLSNFLLLHAAPNQVLKKDDLPCVAGQNLIEMATTKDTRTLCVRKVPFYQKGAGNPDDDMPVITAFDTTACNGVIHTLDKVLLFRPIPDQYLS